MKNARVLTLYYHRINILDLDYNLLCVSPLKFRQQMLYLKQHYPIIRFEENWLQLDQDAVVITFDDGYRDNLENALPILEELEIPATIFISTGTMEQNRELWWDELERLLFVGNSFPPYFLLKDDEFKCRWNTSTYEHRKNCYNSLHYLIKNYVCAERRDKWFRQLWEWRGLKQEARKENLTLSVEDCREIAKSKMISIGAHTVSHLPLAKLDRESQEKEIKTSIDTLASIINKDITLFSYPFGSPQNDFNKDSVDICKRMGICKAASTEEVLWTPIVDPYRIPRKVIRDWELAEFEQKIRDYWER